MTKKIITTIIREWTPNSADMDEYGTNTIEGFAEIEEEGVNTKGLSWIEVVSQNDKISGKWEVIDE